MMNELLGTLLVLGGLGVLALAGREASLLRHSRRWLPARGTILRSALQTVGRVPHIVYEYQVGPRVFRSDQVCLGVEMAPDLVKRLVQEYPESRPVVVWFDPSRPELSCLERHAERPALGVVLGTLFALLGAAVVFGVV